MFGLGQSVGGSTTVNSGTCYRTPDRILREWQRELGLSDAGAHTSQLCDADYATHLLGHWCRERRTLSIEDAVGSTHHPKVEPYDGYLYLILHGIDFTIRRNGVAVNPLRYLP